MSANCPSSTIANWPISASIARTFRALQPGTTTADLPSAHVTNRQRPPCAGVIVFDFCTFHCSGKGATCLAMTGIQTVSNTVHIIGAGLAGSEAAWQLANAGALVVLHEMRPERMTEAHRTASPAELVCSNSFRSDDAANNAVGLLHAEMRRLGSLIMRAADANQVPAGGALAVDRDGFAAAVAKALEEHPRITLARGEIKGLPPTDWSHVIVATGPLTSRPLADA